MVGETQQPIHAVASRRNCESWVARLASIHYVGHSAGDIPHKVILDELVRQRRVIVTKDRACVSIAKPQRGRYKHRQEQDALAFAAMFLTDALRPDSTVVRRRERIAAAVNVSDVYVENAVAGRVTELLDQMPQVFGGGKGRKRETLNLYALLARRDSRR